MSNETRRHEVYVRAFPSAAGKWQISAAGGGHPRWSRDGKELFYVTPEGALMSVKVETTRRFEVSAATRLFGIATHLTLPDFPSLYDVTPDGRRFLFLGRIESPRTPITVNLNWTSALDTAK